MDILSTRKYNKKNQYLISILLIIATSVFCFFSVSVIGYQAVALILLLTVSLNAILFDIFPVMLSALLSALIWNFFFIPPTLTLHIGTPEDGLMFLMYFVIASINAVLTLEYYHDTKGVIIKTGNTNGFKTRGASLNLDYIPVKNLICRLEGRWLNSKENIFETQTTPARTNSTIGASLVIKFSSN